MKSVVIIPAHMTSTRLPGKLLLSDTGKPLIVHTIEAAKRHFEVLVATDSEVIAKAVRNYAKVIMTPPCKSGTERVRLACQQEELTHDIIVNWQADEPELDSQIVQHLLRYCNNNDIATLATPATDEEYNSSNAVKVVIDNESAAMYFSRAGIPYGGPQHSLRHIGVYAFRRESLLAIPVLDDTTYPTEELEQLQWLQAGMRVRVCVTFVDCVGINTREEYDDFVRRNV